MSKSQDTADSLKARKGKDIPASKRPPTIGDKSTIARTVRGAPEVMVKIASNVKDQANLNRVVDYICDKGKNVLEDENQNQFIGPHARKDAIAYWSGFPEGAGKRREGFHIVFSMPAGTDPHTVTESARATASILFDGHQFVFSTHTDKPRPHVHFMVHMTPVIGRTRLRPGRKELQRWREVFADQLRGRGIDCNATLRPVRGQMQKYKKRRVYEIDQRHTEWENQPEDKRPLDRPPLSRITQSNIDSGPNGDPMPSNFQNGMINTRTRVVREYRDITLELFKGDQTDRELAKAVMSFVASMPPVATKQNEQVAELKQPEPSQTPDNTPER